MVKVDDWKTPLLAEAVAVWTGWGREIMPRRDDSSLVTHFGSMVGSELLPMVKSIADEFYTSDARDTVRGLAEMERMAIRDFKKKHPMAPDEIVSALA